jgi:hypothetical protein
MMPNTVPLHKVPSLKDPSHNSQAQKDLLMEPFDDGSFSGRGPFVTGAFSDGTFCDGSFCDGTFCDGTFCDGSFCDGTFCDGSFSDGSLSRCTVHNGTPT